ncbi:MAG: cob(I)yrinic acid a,c-diamide adenosyltransferase [Firmicutes bacterium]|nr:cob(I)yrinic acid a,c-diamide adenosyltransferase [Bacillota bacterium]
MKIYTKKGDSGYTKLGTGDAIRKSDARVEAYGTVDELSSFIGLAVSGLQDEKIIAELLWVQGKLFTIGSILAFPGRESSSGLGEVGPGDLNVLEEAMDRISGLVPPLTGFVLPGGSKEASILHCARSICRRAERRVSCLDQGDYPLGVNVLPFLNRLSDYLFCAARLVNHLAGYGDYVAKIHTGR